MLKANRCSASDRNHLGFQSRTWGEIGSSRRAQLFRPRGSGRRPPPNSDELRRRRAKDRAALCLLGQRSVPSWDIADIGVSDIRIKTTSLMRLGFFDADFRCRIILEQGGS
jgi:hypothetical protein